MPAAGKMYNHATASMLYQAMLTLTVAGLAMAVLAVPQRVTSLGFY